MVSIGKSKTDTGGDNLKKLDPKPLECYQEEGDVVFVPNFFRHSVFNIGEVIAISAVHYENDDGDGGGDTRGYRSTSRRTKPTVSKTLIPNKIIKKHKYNAASSRTRNIAYTKRTL